MINEDNKPLYLLLRPGDDIKNYAISKNFNIDLDKNKIINKRDNSELIYNLNSKVLVYEDRQNEWFLEIAKQLKSNNEAGFVILMIASSYIESNQQYREGKPSQKNSREFFKRGLSRIFSELNEDQQERLYSEVRCGFFHDGITRKAIFITGDQKTTFSSQGENIVINPHLFLDEIKKDFQNYISELKDSSKTELRNKFEKFWDGFKGI
jgi:hypothetical protein